MCESRLGGINFPLKKRKVSSNSRPLVSPSTTVVYAHDNPQVPQADHLFGYIGHSVSETTKSCKASSQAKLELERLEPSILETPEVAARSQSRRNDSAKTKITVHMSNVPPHQRIERLFSLIVHDGNSRHSWPPHTDSCWRKKWFTFSEDRHMACTPAALGNESVERRRDLWCSLAVGIAFNPRHS